MKDMRYPKYRIVSIIYVILPIIITGFDSKIIILIKENSIND
jgi:hypothetical protein